jgi:transposase
MRGIDLYRQVLGLAKPRTVERVDMDVVRHRVDICVEHESGAVWSCPHCGRELTLPGPCRRAGLEASGHLPVPDASACTHTAGGLSGTRCSTGSGAVGRGSFAVHAADGAAGNRCIDPMRHGERSVPAAGFVVGRSVGRDGTRGGASPAPQAGEGDTALWGGRESVPKGHNYMTLVCDLDAASVEYVAEDRTAESLEGYWKGLTQAGAIGGYRVGEHGHVAGLYRGDAFAGAGRAGQDRDRPVSHHASHERGGGYGAQAGTQGVAGPQR